MPFSLPDLKRSYGRSGTQGGPPDVRPYLLAGSELTRQLPVLEAAIDWFSGHIGASRRETDMEEFAQLVGDYRLARCLASCLQVSFAFRSPSFEDVARETSPDDATARRLWHRLQEVGAPSASALRLFVFDATNRSGGGFVLPEERPARLASLAGDLGAAPDQLETLLWSDAADEERLTRIADPPAPASLAAHYNRRAIETLLTRSLSADLLLASPDGATIRRLYFAVKRAGLLCELELADPHAGPGAGVWAHLFGPLEVFGPRTRHGDRFARALLELFRAFPDLQGSARVLINEREYVFRLPAGTGDLVRWDAGVEPEAGEDEAPELDGGDGTAVVRRAGDEARFDSAMERHLYETLRGMERRGDTRGWLVEREPEPIVKSATVLVPDFVLSRDGKRVYVEVIGFWTPSYRERKKAKLLALGGEVDLVLIVDETLARDFEGLPYPILSYRRRPSAVDLVALLEREYGESQTPRDPVPAQVRELLADGVWMAALLSLCRRVVPTAGGTALETLRDAVRASGLENAAAAAEHLEVLLPRLGLTAVWESLFDAAVTWTE